MRAGRRKEEDLIGPPVPEELEYLWVWHAELTRTREMGTYGPKALSYAEIDAFARLTDRNVEPHEVDALLQLDLASRVLTPEPD